MTREELKDRLRKIDKERDSQRASAFKDYALSHNRVKFGDVVKDHIGYGRVKAMSVSIDPWNSSSQMIYNCDIINKDGSPRKRGETSRNVWQENIVEINGERI